MQCIREPVHSMNLDLLRLCHVSQHIDEPPAPADKGASASSLLQRAKTAEALVQSLRRQMAAIIAATAANTAVTMQNETSNITNTGTISIYEPFRVTMLGRKPCWSPYSSLLFNVCAHLK